MYMYLFVLGANIRSFTDSIHRAFACLRHCAVYCTAQVARAPVGLLRVTPRFTADPTLAVGLHLQFPTVPWHAYTNSHFAETWASYTLLFERVLAQWEASNFDQIRPAGALPAGGLTAAIL